MTPIDLESPWVYRKTLRIAVTTGNDSADFTLNGHGAPAGMDLYSGEHVTELLTDLTTRRARDAEVEALVAAAESANSLIAVMFMRSDGSMPTTWHTPIGVQVKVGDIQRDLEASLAPFAGATP